MPAETEITTPRKAPSSTLTVEDLSVTYSNGARGVSKVSLEVSEGEIVAVLGRNGAGKTTTLRAIGGFLRSERVAVSGRIRLGSQDLAGASPMKNFQRGVVLVPERDKVFPGLTVAEHLRLTSKSGVAATHPCAFEAIDRLRQSKAGLLSGGERQMLALEMAWRSNPRLLLVDEASLGLAPVIVKDLMSRLRIIARERSLAVIVVEQDASTALRVADRVYVINRGVLAWEGPAAETSAKDLAREYLGTGR